MGAFGGTDKRLQGFPDPDGGSASSSSSTISALQPPDPQENPTTKYFAKRAARMTADLGMSGTILTPQRRNSDPPLTGNAKTLLGV